MEKLELFILRRSKKIKLRELAKYLHCSVSLISLFERDKRTMSNDRVQKYEEFIKNFNHKQTGKGRCEDEH